MNVKKSGANPLARRQCADRQASQSGLVCILAGIEEMSAQEVKDRVGLGRYRAIRARDPHPMFVELLAGHEGWSSGRLMTGKTGLSASPRAGKRTARKRWTRARVSELASRLRAGVPLFLYHAAPPLSGSAPAGGPRKQVGEIIAAAEQWVKGMISATGIAYVSDPAVRQKLRSGELDTCSIEAEVECHRPVGRSAHARDDQADDSWIVDAVRKVTGVALGNSRVVKPGFPGAAVLAAVEEFENEEGSTNPSGRVHLPAPRPRQAGADPEGGGQDHDRPDLAGLKPSQVFDREKLLDDPVVSRMISACRERDAQRIQDLATRLQAKEKKLSELDASLQRLRAAELEQKRAIRAEDAAERLLAERGVPGEERSIVLEEIRKRPPPDQDLEKAVEAKVQEELTKIARLKNLLASDKIATPPEKPGGGLANNPLIPRPRGW